MVHWSFIQLNYIDIVEKRSHRKVGPVSSKKGRLFLQEMARVKANLGTASKPKSERRSARVSKKPISDKLPEKVGSRKRHKPGYKRLGIQKTVGQESIVHYIYKSTLGQSLHSQMRQCLQGPFLRSLDSYMLHRTISPFDRRVTCLEWHPTHSTTLAVASKGGDIVLWDYSAINKTNIIQGVSTITLVSGNVFKSDFIIFRQG